MNKRTYFGNLYTLYQYSNKPPILHYQDFTLSLTPDGTIHLTTPSKEFDSIAHIFNTIKYWQDSYHPYADTLIGIEIANAISEVMLYSGLRFPYYMDKSYYDFINASLKYYNINAKFLMNYDSNRYLNSYPTEYIGSKVYINPLKQLGISTEHTLPLTFSEHEEGYFMALRFQENEFLELPIHKSIINVEYGKVRLRCYYRTLCNLLYHSGYALTEDGKLYSNKCFIIQEEHKALLEKLLQKMSEDSL